MLNVLLADDETRTLHHLMTGVPWFQLGMEVCCTASNGSEALAFIESHPIDILITDIRMPGMDGLELCPFPAFQTDEFCKRLSPQCREHPFLF